MKYCLIFSREIFYVTIVLCLNILWLKVIDEITVRHTRTSKHDYLTTQIELVLPTFFNSWTVYKIIEYLTLGLLSSLWNIYHSTTAYFFDPPCRWMWRELCRLYNRRRCIEYINIYLRQGGWVMLLSPSVWLALNNFTQRVMDKFSSKCLKQTSFDAKKTICYRFTHNS